MQRIMEISLPDKNEILLPYRTTKCSVYMKYLNDFKADSNIPASRSTFNSIWKNHFPHLKIKEVNSFSKCTVCSSIERRMEIETSPTERAELLEMRQNHNQRQMLERKYYYGKREESRNDPQRYLSLIIDRMDQSKMYLPHFVGRRAKIINTSDLLKTHITGIINYGANEFHTYWDINQYPHDPNLTINILLKRLIKISQEHHQKLPSVLYLQADNCWRENKNRFVLSFGKLLVEENIFHEVHISYLLVDYTHEDIDAGFSKIEDNLRRNDAETIDDLLHILPKPEEVNNMLDVKAWLLPYQHHYKFMKVSGVTN